MKHAKKIKPGQKPTSAPRTYTLEPITGLWIDKQGRAYRLDTHGTHKSTSGEDLPNRLDLVPVQE